MLYKLVQLCIVVYGSLVWCDTSSNDQNGCKTDTNRMRMYDNIDYEEENNYNIVTPKLQWVVTHSYVKCSGIYLKPNMNLFPSEVPYNLLTITFQESNLSLVPGGLFDPFPNLTRLNMSYSWVKVIHPGAFNHLIALEELYLNNNNLDKVSKGVLNALGSLTTLELQDNNIEEIEEYAFIGLTSLRHLNIGNNRLMHVLPTTFDLLKSLYRIDFSHNLLTQFHPNEMPSVVYCDISFNLLETFDFVIFPNGLWELELQHNQVGKILSGNDTRLSHAYLSRNNLTELVDVGTTITYLDLSANNIRLLTNFAIYNNSRELETLLLGQNNISNLTGEIPDVLPALQNFYLDHNLISKIPIGFFRNLIALVSLDLSHNQISIIDYGTFSGLYELHSLDLSFNRLKHLYESSIYHLAELKDLFLQNNKLVYVNAHDLKAGLKSLSRIQLEGNNWTCTVLSKVVTAFRDLDVSVSQGDTKTSTNIHGISCIITDNQTIFTEGVLRDFSRTDTESVTALKKYFNEGFFSSKFFRYFDKWSHPDVSGHENGVHYAQGDVGNTFYILFNCILVIAILVMVLLIYVQLKWARNFWKQVISTMGHRINHSEANLELI